jgi:ABC-type polysaccharide/polyol phosphate export permease
MLDPITYTVDALRGIILGDNVFNLFFDLSIVAGFSLAMVLIGTYAFSRMKV